MDKRELDERVARLESAIAQQDAQTGDGHQDVVEHISRCKEAFEGLKDVVIEVGNQAASVRAETHESLAALKAVLADFDPGLVSRLEQNLAESTEARRAAELRVEQFETEMRGHTDKVEAGRQRVGQLEKELETHVATEKATHERIQRLEIRLSEESAALQPAKKRVAALEQELSQRDEALHASQRQVAEMETHLGSPSTPDAADRVAQLEAREAELKAELESLRSRARETATSERALSESLEATQLEVEGLKAELAGRPAPTEGEYMLEKQLVAQRERADKAVEELQRAKKSALAQQLAEALEEGEKAQEELAAMRNELEELRKAATKKAKEKRAEKDEKSREREQQIRKAASTDTDVVRRRMGDILVDAGVITAEQLKEALSLQKRSPGVRLGSVLVQKNFTDEDTVAQVLASQLDIEFLHIDEDTISADAARLIKGSLAEHHCCIPVRASADTLTLAMTNPLDLIAIEDIGLASSRSVEPVVATTSDITSSISQFYNV